MKGVIDFNHISSDLSEEEVSKLKTWYRYYHKLQTCYKWKYKRLKRLRLSLNMTSAALVVVGSIAGGVTANPIVLGSISGPGLLIQGYITKSNINNKIEMCKFGYTSYKRILIQLRSYLRGMPFDEAILLSDLKGIDDIATDLCPAITKMAERYDKKYINIDGY